MKRKEIKIYRYELPFGFFAEIELRDDPILKRKTYDCFLYHTAYIVKEHIFGLPEFQECENKHYSLEEIEDILETNLYSQNYFESYYEDYMMYDEKLEGWLETINEWCDYIESEE